MWLTLLTGDRPLLYKMIKTIQHIQCCFPMCVAHSELYQTCKHVDEKGT